MRLKFEMYESKNEDGKGSLILSAMHPKTFLPSLELGS